MHYKASLISVILLFASHAAHSCSCVKRTLEQQFFEAKYVFVGHIGSVRVIQSRAAQPGWKGLSATFTVQRDIKGAGAPGIAVETGLGGGDCGFQLDAGKTYLLFVDHRDEVGICSGTQALLSGYEPHDQTVRFLEGLASRAR